MTTINRTSNLFCGAPSFQRVGDIPLYEVVDRNLEQASPVGMGHIKSPTYVTYLDDVHNWVDIHIIMSETYESALLTFYRHPGNLVSVGIVVNKSKQFIGTFDGIVHRRIEITTLDAKCLLTYGNTTRFIFAFQTKKGDDISRMATVRTFRKQPQAPSMVVTSRDDITSKCVYNRHTSRSTKKAMTVSLPVPKRKTVLRIVKERHTSKEEDVVLAEIICMGLEENVFSWWLKTKSALVHVVNTKVSSELTSTLLFWAHGGLCVAIDGVSDTTIAPISFPPEMNVVLKRVY